MSHETLHYTKLDLALRMIKRAVPNGLKAGYVLFDSWYSCLFIAFNALGLFNFMKATFFSFSKMMHSNSILCSF